MFATGLVLMLLSVLMHVAVAQTRDNGTTRLHEVVTRHAPLLARAENALCWAGLALCAASTLVFAWRAMP